MKKKLHKLVPIIKFSLQLDESTPPNNASLLLAYVRYAVNGILRQELLFARLMETDTKGESIFMTVKEFFLKSTRLIFKIFCHVPQMARLQ